MEERHLYVISVHLQLTTSSLGLATMAKGSVQLLLLLGAVFSYSFAEELRETDIAKARVEVS